MKTKILKENSNAVDELQRGDVIMFPDYRYKHVHENRKIPRRMLFIKFEFKEMERNSRVSFVMKSIYTVFLYPLCQDYPPLVTFDESGSPFYCEKTDVGLDVSLIGNRCNIINSGEIHIGLSRILEALESMPQYAPHAASLRVVHGI